MTNNHRRRHNDYDDCDDDTTKCGLHDDEPYGKYVFNASGGNETCVFYSSALDGPLDDVPWKLVNMSFKSLNVDSKLVLTLLANHGFREVSVYV